MILQAITMSSRVLLCTIVLILIGGNKLEEIICMI